MSKLKAIKDFLKSTAGLGPEESVRGLAKTNPLIALGLGVPAAGFIGSEIVSPIARGAYDASPIPSISDDYRGITGRRYENYQESLGNKAAQALKSQRIEEMVQRNMAIVAQRDPHLYNQVMAGRVLPKGAVVLGGPRRQDLMEELAYAMGTSSSPEDFSSLVS
tara:strand:+ start:521 stop:1012 length:492 start_codon:yes stop_codon:yes gene_type:complete